MKYFGYITQRQESLEKWEGKGLWRQYSFSHFRSCAVFTRLSLQFWSSSSDTLFTKLGSKRRQQRQWIAGLKRWKIGDENWERRQLSKCMLVSEQKNACWLACWGGLGSHMELGREGNWCMIVSWCLLRFPGLLQATAELHGSGIAYYPTRQSAGWPKGQRWGRQIGRWRQSLTSLRVGSGRHQAQDGLDWGGCSVHDPHFLVNNCKGESWDCPHLVSTIMWHLTLWLHWLMMEVPVKIVVISWGLL